VALGWGPASALIGGITAAVGLGALFGLPYMAAFALTIALPAWWLGRLAWLARPLSEDPKLANLTPVLDWYPTGRLLVWIAGFAAVTTMSALLTLGTDEPTITASLRRGLMRIMSAGNSSDVTRLVDGLTALAPAAATLIAMVTLTFNLWLAGKITQTSGRLKRPWPELRATTLPQSTLAALIAALLLCFAGGLIAMFAQIVSAALMMAYAMTGFAVLHTLTQTLSGRGFILGLAYLATLFIGWPLLAMIGLGLADALLGIRRRYWAQRGPPPAPTS